MNQSYYAIYVRLLDCEQFSPHFKLVQRETHICTET
jgi:hypothetical protein